LGFFNACLYAIPILEIVMTTLEFDRILKRPEVEKLTGLSRSEIYRRLETKTFPTQVRLGPKAVGWKMSDLQKWIDSLESAA
jgi:prophage regulatory protein